MVDIIFIQITNSYHSDYKVIWDDVMGLTIIPQLYQQRGFHSWLNDH